MRLEYLLNEICDLYPNTEIARDAEKFRDMDCEHCKHCTTFNAIDSCKYYNSCKDNGIQYYFEPKEDVE